ncbi:Endoribonuclease Nob1 [uncultured archaeon]|nr:Endoribonuclease Nob1 [uncultured archaeon]
MKPIRVLDASAILRSTLDFSGGNYLMPHSVAQEVREGNEALALNAAIEAGAVKIEEPTKDALKTVEEAAKSSGDLGALSRPDLDVLAVAFKNKAAIVSDDYAVQNVARRLKLNVEASFHKGIREEITWVFVCGGCGKESKEGIKECAVCGSQIKRKRRR